jgi:KDO2-lipid IV(A) lauroyltransferase
MAAELPHLWLRPADQALQPPPRWDGAEHIERAIARGHGMVLMTPHVGCFEVIAQAYAERFGARSPMTAMYRPPRHASLRKIVETARARPGLLTAPASLGGVRQMIRALRRGETVGLLPDQVPPDGMGVWAPFFGRDAYTMTLAARLIEQTGATPLLLVGERLPRAAGFCIHVMPMPEPLPAGGAGDTEHQRVCASVINRAMEHVIRRWPGQYVWGYDRYKSPRTGAGAEPLA